MDIEMQVNTFFFQVYLAGPDLQLRQLLGTAFPIAPNGGLITCRHVVDVNKKDDEIVVVVDGETNSVVPVQEVLYPQRLGLDLAYIPDSLQRRKKEFFPVLSSDDIIMGQDVYSVGFYVAGGNTAAGYFKGNIVNFVSSGGSSTLTEMSLSYAVMQGLSGSPVLTYHHGLKVVGLCHMNLQTRLAPNEILEYRDEQLTYQETVTRIVELGRAYHANVLLEFLAEVNARVYVVSSERVPGIF